MDSLTRHHNLHLYTCELETRNGTVIPGSQKHRGTATRVRPMTTHHIQVPGSLSNISMKTLTETARATNPGAAWNDFRATGGAGEPTPLMVFDLVGGGDSQAFSDFSHVSIAWWKQIQLPLSVLMIPLRWFGPHVLVDGGLDLLCLLSLLSPLVLPCLPSVIPS